MSFHLPPQARDHIKQIQEEILGKTGMVIDVVAAVRYSDAHPGLYWLCKRKENGGQGGQAGMWEYPGGKVESGEQLRDAMRRELREEFGVEAKIMSAMDVIAYGRYRVTFFTVQMPDPAALNDHTEVRWVTPEEACALEHLPSGTIFNARHLAHINDPATAQRKELLSDILHTYVYGGSGQAVSDEGIARIVDELDRWRVSIS